MFFHPGIVDLSFLHETTERERHKREVHKSRLESITKQWHSRNCKLHNSVETAWNHYWSILLMFRKLINDLHRMHRLCTILGSQKFDSSKLNQINYVDLRSIRGLPNALRCWVDKCIFIMKRWLPIYPIYQSFVFYRTLAKICLTK